VPRALWKGYLKIAELSCPVALHAAASTSGRVSFHTVNRATGNRVRRQYVDEETGEPVERDDQVKGYETDKGQYVVLEPDEIAAAIPESDKTIDVKAFVDCDAAPLPHLDRPYFLTPDGAVAQKTYALIREGLEDTGTAAIARAVLFRRVRSLLIRPQGDGLLASTLSFDYEVRDPAAAFGAMPDLKIKGEMLELARHIISTKRGEFDPAAFEDRYDAALREIVQAKLEGRDLPKRKQPKEEKVVDLMAALRASAKAAGAKAAAKPAKAAPAGRKAEPKRKAG